jgi:hypothetical protein
MPYCNAVTAFVRFDCAARKAGGGVQLIIKGSKVFATLFRRREIPPTSPLGASSTRGSSPEAGVGSCE